MTRHHLQTARSLVARGVLVAAFLAVLAPAVADAGTFAAYGPQEFFRDPSLGSTESEFFFETFSVTQPALTYTLRVERVRATLVEVDINGTQVVERRDFIDAGSDVVEKTISLNDVNMLELEMQADPDGLVTITIFGPDDDSPIISAVRDPGANANGWNNTAVTVSFDCSDVTSGIAVCPAPIYQTAETSGRVISGQAVDLAGNTAETSVTVRVDLGNPSMTVNTPTVGQAVLTPTVLVTGTVSDGLSGIDTVTCNDEAAAVAAGAFSCTVDLYLGGNTITVEATDLAGNVAIVARAIDFMPPDVVKQLTDDQAPTIVIDTPADGSQVAVTGVTAEATITGRVIDLLQGFNQPVNPEVEISVTAAGGSISVDTATAEVSNGTFSAADVRLRRGSNTITATATDAAGNSASDTVTVDVQELSGQRIEEVSGDNQSGEVDTTLAEDLVVRLLDLSGSAVSGRNVSFEVSRGAGSVDGARSATVTTDSSGEALVGFAVGKSAGVGNNQVTATATGFAGSVVFTASATPGAAVGVKEASPTDRLGSPSTTLPEPLVVYAHDSFGNPVPDTDVEFMVSSGAGQFTDASLSATRTTGDDGRALVFYILGSGTSRNDNAVTANLSGVTDPLDGDKPLPATFKLSPSEPNSGLTSVFGQVLDQNYEPVSTVSMVLIDSPIEDTDADCNLDSATKEIAVTDFSGIYSLSTAFTDRRVTLLVDGTAVGHGMRCLEVIPYTDRATNLGPIFLPSLQTDQDAVPGVTLALDDLPGSSLTIAAGSVSACPDPSPTTCDVSFTRLANDQLPALPPRGRMPAVAWSLMPLGVTFDTPAELTVPNTGGFEPGEVVDLWELDHDLAQFVRFGTATVSDDGASITSDEGVGITRSGVGYVSSSLLENTWVFSCDDGNDCTCDNPSSGYFVSQLVDCGALSGDLMLTADPDDGFNAGLCFHEPLDGPCEDGLFCTHSTGLRPPGEGSLDGFDPPSPDACSGGGCLGLPIEDDLGTNTGRVEIDVTAIKDIKESFSRFKSMMDPFTNVCEFQLDFVPNLTVRPLTRCCESEQQDVSGFRFTPQLFSSLSLSCRLFGLPTVKGLITFGGSAGASMIYKLQADIDVTECPDDDCSFLLANIVEIEPFFELKIDILSGAAGASAKGAFPVGAKAETECDCSAQTLGAIAGATAISALPTPFPFSIEFVSSTGNCSETVYSLCYGPLRFEGRIKLLGFIKIGFDIEVDGTDDCCQMGTNCPWD